jgi:MFS family permease
VWAVLVSQVLVYPGLSDLVAVLGGRADLGDATVFLVAEFAAFVAFAGVWGAASDALGRRVPLAVFGGLLGAVAAVVLLAAPTLGLPWAGVLVVRAVSGAASVGVFSLAVTMLADRTGGSGRNLGAAGVAIGLGAALGSVVGGQLTAIDPLAPLVGTATLLVVAVGLVATTADRVPVSEGSVGRGDARQGDPDPSGESTESGPRATSGSAGVGLRPVVAAVSKRPGLLVPYAFGLVDRMTAGFFALVGVFYFRSAFGLDAAGAGLVLAAFFLPFALLQYPLGVVSDRIGRVVPVVAGSILYGVAIVAVGLAPTLPLAVAAMVVVGVAGALVAPATMALVVDVSGPVERGTAVGGFNVFGSLGFLAGFLLGGFAADTAGFLEAFLLVGGLEVAIAVVAGGAVAKLAAPDPDSSGRPTESSLTSHEDATTDGGDDPESTADSGGPARGSVRDP